MHPFVSDSSACGIAQRTGTGCNVAPAAPIMHGCRLPTASFPMVYRNVSMRVGLSTCIMSMASASTPFARILGMTLAVMWSHPWPP